MKPGEVVIYLLNPETVSEETAFATLNDDEQLRAKRFRSESDSLRWSSFRAQMRMILGESLGLPPLKVPLIVSDQGKPLLAPPHDGLHFNLSHCAELGVIGLCRDGPIGVDIESLDRAADLPECESIFCHPGEIRRLPANRPDRAKQLLEIWTAKEALLKALGIGLMHPPESICLNLEESIGSATSDTFMEDIADLRIHLILDKRLENHRAVLAAPRAVDLIRILG